VIGPASVVISTSVPNVAEQARYRGQKSPDHRQAVGDPHVEFVGADVQPDPGHDPRLRSANRRLREYTGELGLTLVAFDDEIVRPLQAHVGETEPLDGFARRQAERSAGKGEIRFVRVVPAQHRHEQRGAGCGRLVVGDAHQAVGVGTRGGRERVGIGRSGLADPTKRPDVVAHEVLGKCLRPRLGRVELVGCEQDWHFRGHLPPE
jgi:hypothetical protein